MTDVNGKPIFPKMSAAAKAKGSAELRYTWVNPATRKSESKLSYLERVGDYAVGVGYYQNQSGK